MADLVLQVCTTSVPAVLTVVGEFDSVRAAEFRRRSHDVPAGDLVLDVSGVRFFDAGGLRALLELQARVHLVGANIVLVAVPRPVRLVLTIAALDRAFCTARTVEEAVVALSAARDSADVGSEG